MIHWEVQEMRQKLWMMILACVFVLGACGDDGSTGDPVEPVCTVNDPGGCQTSCGTQGTKTCDSTGHWSPCSPPVETCNDIDDNCNGQVDEGLTCDTPPPPDCAPAGKQQPCVVTTGDCQAVGQQVCGNDSKWGVCTVTAVEICNQVDDDCDGQVDEGLNCGGDDKCTTGATQDCLSDCGTVGNMSCVNGTWAPCEPPAEDCNGKDDDCDNQIDESLEQKCVTVCGDGTQTCNAGSWTVCSAQVPSIEICDGIDNDCDKKTDEGDDGQPLTQECENCGTGFQTCANKVWGECSAQPQTEICDGKDNDCNGVVDDAVGGCSCTDGQTQACGTETGECNPGTQNCVSGKWTECAGANYKGSEAEKCDGLDNDCNGVVDEGNPDGGASCGTANKTVDNTSPYYPPCDTGVMNCVQGQIKCVGGVDPTPELCDEIDNDCDGSIDNNITGDQYESNETCSAATDLGYVIENQGKMAFHGTMFPDQDTDWFTVIADELGGFCWPGSEEGPYLMTITLKDIPAGSDYDLCVWSEDAVTGCGDAAISDTGPCEELGFWKAGSEPETYNYDWPGECASSDQRVFYVKVINYDFNDAFDCSPYTLEMEVTSGN